VALANESTNVRFKEVIILYAVVNYLSSLSSVQRLHVWTSPNRAVIVFMMQLGGWDRGGGGRVLLLNADFGIHDRVLLVFPIGSDTILLLKG